MYVKLCDKDDENWWYIGTYNFMWKNIDPENLKKILLYGKGYKGYWKMQINIFISF